MQEVRWLSLQGLAELWASELRMPEQDVLHELQLGIINLPLLELGEPLIEELPPQTDLPTTETRVVREWVVRFCDKQRWPLPSFWFPQDGVFRRPGRPSPRESALTIFRERIERNEVEPRISQEARAIIALMHENPPAEGVPQSQTIQKYIRELFNSLHPNV